MTSIEFTPEAHNLIETWNHSGTEPVQLTFITGNQELEWFCDELTRRAPRARIKTVKNDGTRLSEIQIAPNISYRALPLGVELAPFLKALAPKALPDILTPNLKDALKRIDIPAPLKVYIAPHCPYCPLAVAHLLALASANSNIGLIVIDGTRFTEQARADHVSSAPTTILDDRFRWTGALPLNEVVTAIVDRDPAKLSADTLRQMLEDGRAHEIARMMASGGRIFPAFIELLCHTKWPVRLAAMVVQEYLAEESTAVSTAVVEPLQRRFDALEDPIKGDVLHVLGTVRTPQAVLFLRSVAEGPYEPSVKNAAVETLTDIHG